MTSLYASEIVAAVMRSALLLLALCPVMTVLSSAALPDCYFLSLLGYFHQHLVSIRVPDRTRCFSCRPQRGISI